MSSLKRQLEEFKSKGISATGDRTAYCSLCAKEFTAHTHNRFDKYRVKAHIDGSKHQAKKLKSSHQPSIASALASSEANATDAKEFRSDLTKMLISCGIPLYNLE